MCLLNFSEKNGTLFQHINPSISGFTSSEYRLPHLEFKELLVETAYHASSYLDKKGEIPWEGREKGESGTFNMSVESEGHEIWQPQHVRSMVRYFFVEMFQLADLLHPVGNFPIHVYGKTKMRPWRAIGNVVVSACRCRGRTILWLADGLCVNNGQTLVFNFELFLAFQQANNSGAYALILFPFSMMSCSMFWKQSMESCRSVMRFTLSLGSASLEAIMEDISEEKEIHAGISGEMKLPIFLPNDGAGWRSVWEWLGVSCICMKQDTLYNLDIGVPHCILACWLRWEVHSLIAYRKMEWRVGQISLSPSFH